MLLQALADGLAGAVRSLKTVSRQVLFKIKTKEEELCEVILHMKKLLEDTE